MSEWNKKMLGWSYFEKIIVGFTRELGGRNDVVIETPELFHTVERHDLSDIRHPAMGSLGHSGGSLRGFRERLWLRGIEVKSPSGKQWVLGRISVTEFRRVYVLQTHTLTLNLLASSKMVFVWESPSEGFSSISPSSSCFFSSTGLSTGEAGLEICSAARALLRVLLLAVTAAGGMVVEDILGFLEMKGKRKWIFGEYTMRWARWLWKERLSLCRPSSKFCFRPSRDGVLWLNYVCVSTVSPTNCVSITSSIDIVVIVYFYFILAHNPRQNGSNN